MTYCVGLDVFQGANIRPVYHTTYELDEKADSLGAMSRAEEHVNVLLPGNQYAVARYAMATCAR